MDRVSGDTWTLLVVRRLLLALLTFGLVLTAVDLYLLAHFEDLNQLVPFAVIGVSVVAVAWHLVLGGAAGVRLLQVAMLFLLAAGAVGVVLHFRGNMAFQLDIDPSLSGWALADKVLRAKAPPTMAPGAMAQLGLLGLIYSYRHPALRERPPS
jgi:hypothetical protein